ncbi:MAG: pyrrolo-quinoline quinone [Acidobacteria bacterium]|nr:MAG: pyrrolo-quinoline quinone [Acidobacteriota bacterium]PYU77075.1 MAG: pyrrolo-quinoline quinone [Acidobacteriota bacterium]
MTAPINAKVECFCQHSSACRIARFLIVALAWGATPVLGQTPPTTAPNLTEGTKIYAQRCAGCHGADAHGTDKAPGLAGNQRLRDGSVQDLQDLIRKGVPGSGMPPFDLPPQELDSLVVLVRSLNAPSAESTVGGDATAGESFFFGKGQCASCHMISGAGAAIGPDLSNVVREMTVDEIQAKLVNPNSRIAPGYELATAQLRNGNTVRGFARNRSNFDILLQDLTGQFHLIQQGEISAITEEKQSIMPSVKASPEELRDLVAYLDMRTGVGARVSKSQPSKVAGIDFARISNPKPGDWLTYNGNLSGNRYSELTQINTTNVQQLTLKWIFSVPLWKNSFPNTNYFVENMRYFGLETTPIVADGIMYVTGPNATFALDPFTGREIWEYSRPRSHELVGDAALGTNRGVAVLHDKVFMVTDNAHLIALNRTTGHVMWEVVMPDEPQHYGSTVAPLIVKDLVIAGVSGADWGIRGFVAAYKASTGERVWRFWTIPSKGEPALETWGSIEPTFGGGSTWLTGSYDPETDTLYWSTGNPFSASDDLDRSGDNLYTNCILALNPDTGKLKWHYQVTPHDVHDWDANAPLVLVDTKYQGGYRKLLLHADKNGFFYVLDRTDGRVLTARNFVRTTWASGIGPDGRPQRAKEEGFVCPEVGTNWNATAFSPVTRLYYVVALEKCEAKLTSSGAKKSKTDQEPGKKYLRAFDIETGKIVWEDPQVGPVDGKRNSGVLATAGGILFYGDPSGDVIALDERDGKVLWHFPTNGINKASPMTHMAGGKQFVALAVGPNILCFGLP